MEIKEIRKRNLLLLLAKYKIEHGMNKKEFAEKCGTAAAVISQVLSNDPNKQKNIGDVLARKIESSLDLKIGWMDTPQWAELDMMYIVDGIADAGAADIAKKLNNKDIYVVMRGSLMEGTQPNKCIPDGADVLICTDFNEAELNGKAVLVELPGTDEQIIRELQKDGQNIYLAPWNQRYEIVKITGDYKVIGYVKEFTVKLHK